MISYKDSGVNIDEGNALVEGLKPLVKSTFDKNVIGGIGSFAGAYELPSGFKKPVILGATDGVGTKLKIAIESSKLDTIGIDLVAMCVNDLICNFAKPIFFLDYYACASLEKNSALRVITGIVEGCKMASCALIGGESAEMPGMYQNSDFDLAGFAVGIAEKDDLTAKKLHAGDILIALPSSGLHSNGYSLARKIATEKLNIDFKGDNPLIDAMLAPTKIYVNEFLKFKDKIHALAHITGGGIVENLPRIFYGNLGANIDKRAIPRQEIFEILGEYVEEDEMWRTFNMGVGLILALDKDDADFVLKNSNGFIIGEINESGSLTLK